jgi:hypothetical protein
MLGLQNGQDRHDRQLYIERTYCKMQNAVHEKAGQLLQHCAILAV